MRLRRRQAQTGRQRIINEQPAQTPTTFSYANSPRQPGAKSAESRTPPQGRLWLKRLGLLVFLVAMTALAVNTISLTPSAKVVSLATGDSQSFLRPDSYYEPIINKLLASSIWNRNKITLNTDQINHQLLSRFPEISSASVTVPLAGHQPTVYIQPAQPVLILAASNGSFVVDASGRALLNAASAAQPFKGLPTLTDQSSLNVSLDHQALPADNVKFIRVVLAELAAKQYQVASMVLPPASSELDVYPAGQPYFIKFNLQNNDARQQAGTFLALAVSLKQQNITPTQYIDVRVDGRAYYK